MSTKDDGGPAFPNDNEGDGTMSGGMSLRDYFAAKAMQSVLLNLKRTDTLGADSATITLAAAQVAYLVADAMLAERAK